MKFTLSLFSAFTAFTSLAAAAPTGDGVLTPATDNVSQTLVARGSAKPDFKEENLPTITQDQYESYLRKEFPNTGKYMLFTGGSIKQVQAFKEKNSDYFYFNDFFDAPKRPHKWYDYFDSTKVQDDADAASRAIASVASGDVLVFGGVEHGTAGGNSWFVTEELPRLQAGMKKGTLKSIHHMAKDATSSSQVIATEDSSGKLAWVPPNKDGTKNASDPACSGHSKRGASVGACDKPAKMARKQVS